MKKLSKHDRAEIVLRRIEQYATLSPFCRVLYRAIFEWLEAPGIEGDKLDQAFQLLLRCECQRHDHVGRIVRSGSIDLSEVLRVGRHARKNLSLLVKVIEKTEPGGKREAMIRELIIAECDSHLGRTRKVIASLRRAIRMGCDHPLACFALGHNLYQDALRNFAKCSAKSGELLVSQPAEFTEACREAIRAFEAGLSSAETRFRAQIWWWIGLLNEAIGSRRAAYEAFTNARATDPQSFAGIGNEKIQRLSRDIRPHRTPTERTRLDRLGPITGEEIARAQEFLARLDDFPAAFVEKGEE